MLNKKTKHFLKVSRGYKKPLIMEVLFVEPTNASMRVTIISCIELEFIRTDNEVNYGFKISNCTFVYVHIIP